MGFWAVMAGAGATLLPGGVACACAFALGTCGADMEPAGADTAAAWLSFMIECDFTAILSCFDSTQTTVTSQDSQRACSGRQLRVDLACKIEQALIELDRLTG